MFKKLNIVEKTEKGEGLVVEECYMKGDFVIEYFGRTVSVKKLKRHGDDGRYNMRIGHKIINGNVKTNIVRFINHSCNPNCILDVRAIMGKKH